MQIEAIDYKMLPLLTASRTLSICSEYREQSRTSTFPGSFTMLHISVTYDNIDGYSATVTYIYAVLTKI